MFKPSIQKNKHYQNHKFDFFIDGEVALSWYGGENQVTGERLWCTDHIRPGMTIVDAGSHHGMVSLIFALATGSAGRVIAYDPLPQNADVVRLNARINGLSNIEVRTLALSDSEGELRLRSNSGNVISLIDNDNAGDLILKTVRLDDDLSADIKVDFLKVDVEGGDLQMLRGAKRILEQLPIINFELHNTLFEDRRAMAKAVFEIFDTRWRYEIMPRDSDPIIHIDGPMDIELIASMDYPHIFGVPRT